MDNLFVCPQPAFIPDVPSQACPIRFDQIQRLLFTRLGTTHFTEANIDIAATWTPRMIASDASKIIGTPKFAGLVIPMPDALKEGGNDNSTINGIPTLSGLAVVSVSGLIIRNMNAAVAKVLRSLAGESATQPGETSLGVYLVNRFKEIIYLKNGTNAEPFPIYNVILSDVGSEGLNRDNTHTMSFDLEPGWSQDFAMKKLTTINPLTIKNAS